MAVMLKIKKNPLKYILYLLVLRKKINRISEINNPRKEIISSIVLELNKSVNKQIEIYVNAKSKKLLLI
jgi:hypothetical protein